MEPTLYEWRVGIDEAGYGPNLGPLVQASAAFRVPTPTNCLWEAFAKDARRAAGRDARVVVDDSKLVHAGPLGLRRLEGAASCRSSPNARKRSAAC